MLTESASRNTQCDLENCEYVLWMGTFPGATGKSFQGISKRVLTRLQAGECTMDVLDPVLGNGCVTPTTKGINWVPIKTATNSAFTLGMIHVMLDEGLNDPAILEFPNYQASLDAGYAGYTNATHLVIVDEDNPNYGKFMRGEESGLEIPEPEDKDAAPKTYYIVIDKQSGEPTLHTDSVAGELEYEGEINGVKVRTAYLFLKDNVYEHTLQEYAEITGVDAATIERIAREFCAHGVKASARGMGGSATANGTDGTFAFRVLNAIIGSNQMTGGCNVYRVGAKATADGARYKLGTIAGKPAVSAKNASHICRTGRLFSATDEYKARVAAGEEDPKPKLPWFKSSATSDNQALMSIVNQYPYQAKILISWMVNTLQATPGAMRDAVIERLEDPAVLPLHIACDAFIGEHAALADYIVPDTTPFESFGVVTNEGYWCGKGNTVRWRAKEPETMRLDDGRYASFEAFACDVARACDLPGFGDNAFEGVNGGTWAFNDAPDYFLKAIANLAYEGEPVADVDPDEAHVQALDELPDAWRAAVTEEEWPKVQNVLSRGGRFWPIEDSQTAEGRSAFAAEYLAYVYSELKATNINPYSGVRPSGALKWVPEDLCDRSPLTDTFNETDFPFRSTNYKPRFRSVSMQANSPIMRDLCAKNFLEINRDDAARLGIADGDEVRVTSAMGDVMEGEALVRAGIAPGTFGMAYGYGHRAYGAQDSVIDGAELPGDPAIGAGVHLQTILDPKVADDVIYALVDHDTATPGRSGGMYKIEKA